MYNLVNRFLKRASTLSETTANTTTAYGDESVRMAGDPPFYMLGVSLMSDATDAELAKLAEIMPKGSRKLHWREMSRKRRKQSLEILASAGSSDTVVIAAPLSGKKQERARRKCLEAMLPALESKGVCELVLENRDEAANRLDLNYVDYAKGSKLVSSIMITHRDASVEPRLWVADQVLGALGDYKTHTGEWKYWEEEWLALSEDVEVIDVSL